jgi:hypothetical protein
VDVLQAPVDAPCDRPYRCVVHYFHRVASLHLYIHSLVCGVLGCTAGVYTVYMEGSMIRGVAR